MNIVVVGGGVAGYRIAKALDATLITDRKEFTFLPLLPEEIHRPGSSTKPIVHKDVLFGRVEQVIPERNSILLGDKEIPYEYLVLATGAQAAMPVPGVKTYAQTFYTVEDAARVRDRLPAKRIVIVGGGPTGVELACELARDGHVMIVHAGEHILGQFPEACRRYAERLLERYGVTVKTGEKVDRVSAKHVHASRKYPYDLCVWTAGVKAVTVKGLPKERGILVDKHLQVQGLENVFAVGDCAQTESPLTAQAAVQEADMVIKNIRRHAKGKPLKNYAYHERGMMLQLHNNACITAGPFRLKGRLAAFIRKLYYWYVLRGY